MPEEVNRVLTDRLSDLLLTPSEDARTALTYEGLGSTPEVFVGNVMIDSLYDMLERARDLLVPESLGIQRGRYILATMHRPSNVDDQNRLRMLLSALKDCAEKMPVLFPMHPRTRARAETAGLHEDLAGLLITEPLGCAQMIGALDGAAAAITDSGGVQEETTVLGVPCLTVRAANRASHNHYLWHEPYGILASVPFLPNGGVPRLQD